MHRWFRVHKVFACFIGLFLCAGNNANALQHNHLVTTPMTVVRMLPAADTSRYVDVCFEKSQRIYHIRNKPHGRYLRMLKTSFGTKKPVLVTRPSETSDEIIAVKRIQKHK